jgi:acyl carrier protein
MNEAAARKVILSALLASGISEMREQKTVEQFLRGETDIAFADLDMDSLATMELCISIEIKTGASILPEDLPHLKTLGSMAKAIIGLMNA